MAKEQYLVLARKWRPQSFEDVVGQEHITRTLQNSIASGRVGHAFLFIGSRGIGKTTTARILAKALNCDQSEAATPHPCGECDNCTAISGGSSIDVVEIDGASNNSVDHVREIRENIRLVPSRSRYKIYIIDEVHQLSSSAFNALLKTLEEPPAHAVFILATTEAHKVPATIISRCQRYDFRRVGLDRVVELLRHILSAEKITCSDEALYAIARASDGGIRDAESILEQLISYCENEVTFQDVFDVLGLVDWRILNDLCDAILAHDVGRLLHIVEDIVVRGKDLSQFVQDILQYFRNLLVCKTADPKALLALPEEDLAAMLQRAEKFTLTGLIRLVEQFAELTKDFDSQLAQRIALESFLIRISRVAIEISIDSVLEKLLQIGAGGIGPAPTLRRTPEAEPRPKPPAAREHAPISASKPPPVVESGPVVLTEKNMAEQWPHIVQAAAKSQLRLGYLLNHAVPSAIEGATLVLRFSESNVSSRRGVESPECRQVTEEALKSMTGNIQSFRSEIVGEQVHAAKGQSASPAKRGAANAVEARNTITDPHVAEVLDVFKGTIVAVRKQEDDPSPRE